MSVPRFSTRDQGESGNASNRVVVVAARFALDEYLKYSAYICQPYRTFQHCVRMAFYKRNTIDYRIPKILGNIEAISRDEIGIRTDLAESARVMLRTLLTKMDSSRSEDWRKRQYKIVFLTSPDSPDTLILPSNIVNTLTSKSGKRTAFTQGQRYVSLARLERGPKTITELI